MIYPIPDNILLIRHSFICIIKAGVAYNVSTEFELKLLHHSYSQNTGKKHSMFENYFVYSYSSFRISPWLHDF